LATNALHTRETRGVQGTVGVSKRQLRESVERLLGWLERNDYRGYDTFDGLNSRVLRPLTFNKTLRIALQQGVRRFPVNLRPVLGISKSRSTKGMGFLARGFLRMFEATGDQRWRVRAEDALQWLMEKQLHGYSGACWGNHFDYQSRVFYLPQNVPTVVWTSLIGHAFLDAYELLQRDQYLRVAENACEHIVRDLDRFTQGDWACISYIPTQNIQVHNANTLAAGLLARTFGITQKSTYRVLAEQSIRYTARHQRADASWYYGEASNLHWVDNFHTAYVLDSFKHYEDGTGDKQFENCMRRGYEYWKRSFFLSDGTPRYYDRKTYPIDIQCCSQAIDTLVFFSELDPDALQLADNVARWTIGHMQSPGGHFYYRRYSNWFVNKTPTLHWGQATMLCALSGLYQTLEHAGRL
jgi:polysaccharide biosynthesis protein VpsJ